MTNGNRTFSVDDEPVTIQYCYNQCSESCVADPDPAPITFQMDMTNETVSRTGVWLIGHHHPQWQAGALQMSDADGDNVTKSRTKSSERPSLNTVTATEIPILQGWSTMLWPRLASLKQDGCGQGNPFGESNRTHTRSGQPEVVGAYCFSKLPGLQWGLGGHGHRHLKNSKILLDSKPSRTLRAIWSTCAWMAWKVCLQIRIYDLTGKAVVTDRQHGANGRCTDLSRF